MQLYQGALIGEQLVIMERLVTVVIVEQLVIVEQPGK